MQRYTLGLLGLMFANCFGLSALAQESLPVQPAAGKLESPIHNNIQEKKEVLFRLKNGRYIVPSLAPESPENFAYKMANGEAHQGGASVVFQKALIEDIDGDGTLDAAVIFTYTPQGSDVSWRLLGVFVEKNGRLTNVATDLIDTTSIFNGPGELLEEKSFFLDKQHRIVLAGHLRRAVMISDTEIEEDSVPAVFRFALHNNRLQLSTEGDLGPAENMPNVNEG